MNGHHLAELNISRLKYDLMDPRVADFVNNLNRVNAAAERSPGFVWRYEDGSGNATGATVLNDPMVISNLSVWETVTDLEHFVFKTVHKRIYERGDEWFGGLQGARFVMWWVEPGHRPAIAEAMARLAYLNQHGSSDHAFGWDHLPEAAYSRQAACNRPVEPRQI
ncbi:uncharacterized protein DUF3291 [Roseibium hamelinense]|uniref:Uncharacterized protein DUF3291 n=1 Tax=Roseibium hamelinense TaxID=150831 RepID=A0A562TH32_9HYPH|nr:DUF3291 domain-containing protein [Roseibium hamelinense]MTI45885.1 DUF3291 domain-containing protein [Roseibium hamelinense]TWI92931.1 uncharacterized protein DUF3291 [Roseibium hamelinense]